LPVQERLRDGSDAWNVTEDIDLGIRLARFGFEVGALASTTHEEAPYRLRAWMGQRQRWQKGWIVTLQTHSRDPARLAADIGPVGALAIFALLCGTVATSLLGPLFMAGVIIDAVYGPLLHPHSQGEKAWTTLVALVVTCGVISLVLPSVQAMRRREVMGLAGWLALLPVYLALISIASWRALAEMAGRPHAWTKTEHGLAKNRISRS
jgi:cellulose synthase/poly-beta-1,6-N-acetylglucosamine synthase-like glycosyltransferase